VLTSSLSMIPFARGDSSGAKLNLLH
jgi:hypothetical protein